MCEVFLLMYDRASVWGSFGSKCSFTCCFFMLPPWPPLNCPEINSDLSCPSVFPFSSFPLSHSRCCFSSSRSRCIYLLCSPSSPLSCSLISAVRQLCLGGSHSIVLAPPSPIGAHEAAGVILTHSTLWKGLAPNHSDTWHFGVLGRLHLWLLCVPFVHRQSSLHSLLQTAAILLLPALPACPPLLHSNQTTQPAFYRHSSFCLCKTLSPSLAAQETTVTLANLKWKQQTVRRDLTKNFYFCVERRRLGTVCAAPIHSSWLNSGNLAQMHLINRNFSDLTTRTKNKSQDGRI